MLVLLEGIGINETMAETVTDTIFSRVSHEEDFAFGADIGFVSQMESWERSGSTRTASKRTYSRF